MAPKNATATATVVEDLPPAPIARHSLIPLAQLRESPSNHRRTWGEMDELTASVRRQGVLQPVLARPIGDGEFELVFGHRRFRAAQAAGLAEIPAMVREMGGLEVLEAQVVENVQRQDVHPLEEAEGYEQLLQQKERPYTVDDVAAKVGKSRAYVYSRLKLLALCPEARAAFYDGKLLASVALYVARIPSELQVKALARVKPQFEEDGPLSARMASDVIQREFMLKLASAPFSTEDVTLVPEAGSCTACPKRTGAQPELFPDVTAADVCSDPVCYREKVDAAFLRRAAEAKEKGREVIQGKAAKEIFEDRPWEQASTIKYNAPYLDPDLACDEDPKRRTYRKLLGKRLEEAAALARDPRGNPRELLPRAGISKLLKAAGHDFKKERVSPARGGASRAEAMQEGAISRAVRTRIVALLMGSCQNCEQDDAPWRLAVEQLLPMDDAGVIGLRFPGPEKESYEAREKRITGEIAKIQWAPELRALALALVLAPEVEYGPSRTAILKWAGIDLKAVDKAVRAELKAKAAIETSPAPRLRSPPKTTSAKGPTAARKKGGRNG